MTTTASPLDNAIRAEGVSDIFALAGLEKPNIGLLSDEFDLRLRANPPGDLRSSMSLHSILEDVRKTPLKNLAIELLERLLKDEIRSHSRTNLVQEKKDSDRLLATLAKYHNRRSKPRR